MVKRKPKKGKAAEIEVRLTPDAAPSVRTAAEQNGKAKEAPAGKDAENPTPEKADAKRGGALEEVRSIVREELKSAMASLAQHTDLTADRPWYTTLQFAMKVDRRPWTIRRRCEEGRLNGVKVGGRGKHGEWRLSHEELVRFQREGYDE